MEKEMKGHRGKRKRKKAEKKHFRGTYFWGCTLDFRGQDSRFFIYVRFLVIGIYVVYKHLHFYKY